MALGTTQPAGDPQVGSTAGATTLAGTTPAKVTATATLKIGYRCDADAARTHAAALTQQLREQGMEVKGEIVEHQPSKKHL